MNFATPLVALGCLIAATAHSATVYLECDNCTEADYVHLAGAYPAVSSDVAIVNVYIADVTRENLRRFRIFEESEPGTHFRTVRRRPPAAAELARFNAYIQARNQILNELDAMDFIIEVPPGHTVGSAYDLWGSNQNRLLVKEVINAQLSFLERLFSDFFATGSFLLDRNSSHILVQVNFPDGSSAYFELAGKMQDLIWVYREGQSIDADGNLIPDVLSGFADYAGLFDPLSVQDFLLRAALYNIPIVDQSAGGSRLAVVCIEDAHGQYACVVSEVE